MPETEAGVTFSFMVRDAINNSSAMQNSLGSLTGIIRRVGAAAITYLSFRSAIHGMRGVISVGSQAENQLTSLTTSLGDATKAFDLYQKAVEFADRTPFETDQLVNAVVKLQAVSIEAFRNVQGSTVDVMTAIGNMAGAMGKSLDQATEAVIDALAGEMERLKEFGITVHQLPPRIKALQRGSAEWREEILKFIATMPRFQGGMERMSTTLTGIMSTIRGFFSTFVRTIAGVGDTISRQANLKTFFNDVKETARGVLKWLMDNRDAILSFARAIGQVLRLVWAVFSNIVNLMMRLGKAILDTFKSWWDELGSGGEAIMVFSTQIAALIIWIEIMFGDLANFIVRHKEIMISALTAIGIILATKLIPLIIAFGAAIKRNLGFVALVILVDLIRQWSKLDFWGKAIRIMLIALTVAIWSLNAAMLANPVTWLIIGIGALIAGVILLIKNFDLVRKWFAKWIPQIVKWLLWPFEAIGRAARQTWNMIMIGFNAIIRFFKTWGLTMLALVLFPFAAPIALVISHWDRLRIYFTRFAEWFGTLFSGIGSRIVNSIKTTIANIINGVISLYNKIATSAIGSRVGLTPLTPMTVERAAAATPGGTRTVTHTSSAVIHIHESANARDTAAYTVNFMNRRFAGGM